MKRIVIVTDAWNQINGVVTTLEKTINELRNKGFDVKIIEPGLFKTFPCPTYPQILLSWNIWKIGKMIKLLKPDYLHIATEGPLGISAKMWADRRNLHYTTSYHTKFPEYINARFGINVNIIYKFMKWFHKHSCFVMVNTNSMMNLLSDHGMKRLSIWGRGVDTNLYTPYGEFPKEIENLPRPIMINVGRISIEKNLPDFYNISIPGTKIQVGDGPLLEQYKKEYPNVLFVGAKMGEELASYYRAANVFVFPSVSDTYGVVILESIASGVPVAAFPVTGPIDIITDDVGNMNNDLNIATTNALKITDGYGLHAWAMKKTWSACTDQFISYLQPI